MDTRNAEHYPDFTASKAIANIVPPEKKRFSLAYRAPVGSDSNPGINIGYGKSVSISEMNMDELKKQLKLCNKSRGNPQACVECMGGCAFGTRAAELLSLSTKEPDGRAQNGQRAMRKAILEYQSALDSGDPERYIVDHMRSKLDDYRKHILARQKLKRWEQNYSAFVKKPVSSSVPEKPERKRRAVAEPAKKELKQDSDAMISKAVVNDAVSGVMKDIAMQITRISKEIQDLTSRRDELEGYLEKLRQIA